MQIDRRVSSQGFARHLGQWRQGIRGNLASTLAEQTRLMVLDGRLPVMTRLPSERSLAAELAISRTTVAAAYDLLRQCGFLQSQQGSGTWIALPEDVDSKATAPWLPGAARSELDLSHAALSAPVEVFHSAMAEATGQLSIHLRGHGYNLLGLPKLREVVAARFSARGLPTHAGQVLITSGAQQALSLAIMAFADHGSKVIVEHPTYPNALDAIRQRGARPVPVPFNEGKWDLDLIASTMRDSGAQLGYFVPDFHNPTGLCMSPADRKQLVLAAHRTRTPLIIDETLVELGIEHDAPEPTGVYGSEEATPIVTIGSASKIFWGGIRVGWLRAPAAVIRKVAGLRPPLDMSSPILEQLIVASLFPRLHEVVAHRRQVLRTARDEMVSQLNNHIPEWRPTRALGGLSLWVDLQERISSRFVSAAGHAGVLLSAGPRFGIDDAFERFVRLPFTVPTETSNEAIRRLAEVWRAMHSQSPAGDVRRGPRLPI